MPPVLDRLGVSTSDNINDDKLIKLEGKPWKLETTSGRTGDGERLQTSIIGCVTKLGYRLSMDITLDIATNTRVFFLIKTTPDDTGCLVTLPNNSGAGLGEKETLCVYRPMLVRHKSSFFRSYHGKTGSFRKRIRSSMRRKVLTKNNKGENIEVPSNNNLAKSTSGSGSSTAWWQQVSTDCSPEQL